MIFKQIDEIVSGKKTQTRRVKAFNEYGVPADIGYSAVCLKERTKWGLYSDYAVCPKRGRHAIWVNPDKSKWRHPVTFTYDMEYDCENRHDGREHLKSIGWQPAKIQILGIRLERLQAITDYDARREGVGSVAEYRALWESINKRKGTRWEDDPEVWVLSFELV